MTTREPMRKLEEMRNLGATIVRRLTEIGIYSEADLQRVGPVDAYVLMQKQETTPLPVCYYLYSLEGALQDKHWDAISEKRKKELLKAIGR